MMKPYMGAYGTMRRPLNQPYNLELQIYLETHGLLRLESKQWGYSTSASKDWSVTYPVSFIYTGIPVATIVGSRAPSVTFSLMLGTDSFDIHQSEAVSTLVGVYWFSIGH